MTTTKSELGELQDWGKTSPATAFNLIERHADNWTEAGSMMECWARAWVAANPVGKTAMLARQALTSEPLTTAENAQRAAAIVACWPAWRRDCDLTKYSPAAFNFIGDEDSTSSDTGIPVSEQVANGGAQIGATPAAPGTSTAPRVVLDGDRP